MANGAFKFKDNSGNVVSFISGSGSDILISGGTLNLSGMAGLTLGNLTMSGTTQNAVSTSHAASYLLTSSFNSYTGTTNTIIGSLQISTGSLNTFTSSTDGRLTSIETSTGSLNSYTTSTNTRLGVIESTTSSLNTYTSSTNTRLGIIEGTTSSLNTFTSSANGRLNSIEEKTGSYATTGSNTFNGNLTVTGYIDTLELRTTYISSSILYRSGSTKFGDESTDTHAFTGSLLVSGSSNPLQVTGIISSVASGTDGGQIRVANSGGGSNWYWAARTTGLNLGELGSADGRIFVANGGNVGINKSTSLNATLDVNGNALVTGSLTTTTSVTAGNGFVATGYPAASGNGLFIAFNSAGTNTGSLYSYNYNTSTYLPTVVDGSSVLFYNSGVAKMGVIGGNVGINKVSSLNATLDVNGNTIVSGSLTTTGAITLSNGQYLKGIRNSGALAINLLGIESGSDRTLMTATGDFVIQNGSLISMFTLTTAGAATFAGRASFSGSTLIGEVQSSYALIETTAGNGIWLRPAGISSPSGAFVSTAGNFMVGTTNADVGGSVIGTVIRPNGSMTSAINMSSPANYTSPIAADRMNTAGDGLMYGMWRAGIFQCGIGATNTQAMTFVTGDGSNVVQTERMRITGANINIGSATAASYGLLGSSNLSTSMGITFHNGSTYSKVGGVISVQESGGSHALELWVRSGGNEGYAVRVTSGGSMGIGTQNPAHKLDVVGSSTDKISTRIRNTDQSGATSLILNSEGNSGVSNGDATIFYDCSSTAWVAGVDKSDSSKYKIANDVYGDFRANNYITIQTNGNIGINTTTPVTKLDVSGNIKNTGRVFSGNSVIGNIATNLNPANTRSYILVCDLNDIAGFSLNGFMNAASYTCWNMSSFYIMKNYSSTTCTAGISGQYKAGGCDMNIVDLSYGGGRYIAIGYTSNPEIDVVWTGYRLLHMLNSDGSAQVIPQSSVTVNATLATY